MTKVVTYEVENGVAILEINNPPVNALSAAVRQQLWQGIERATEDGDVTSIVICAQGRTFPVGADVREFGKPPVSPLLTELCNYIEAAPKPVIAAIHGSALGGGFEIGLASHYRIADISAKVGLPEVLLGILPGAGGTQRVPRLAGAKVALDMILSGKPIAAPKAQEYGLIDRVERQDLLANAKNWARELVAQGPKPTRIRSDGFGNSKAYLAEISARRASLKSSPLPALALIIDCIEAALTEPFDTALAQERAAFMHCVATDQARALRHAFFAERSAAKVPELSQAKPREVSNLGVVGAGLMGAAIAYTCLNAGLPVVLVERDLEALNTGIARVQTLYDGAVAKGRMSVETANAHMAKMKPTTNMTDLGGVDLVIEAVFEEESVKRDVFAALDKVMRPGAILATNTSYLDIDELAATISRPEDVVGFHFFSPAHIMKLMEIVVGEHTDPAVTVTGFALAKRLGKIPVRAGVCDGFIGNRILSAYRLAADYMLEDGATPYQIDAAMRKYGFALGPYQVADMAGLGISWARRKRLAPTRDPEERYVRIGDILCERGRMGQKTGCGYYVYEKGVRKGREDCEVLTLIEAERAAKGISARKFSTEEIQARCVAAMTNEGARLLGEGIALRPSDIDVVLLHGYGFPRWRGGPMIAADIAGLKALVDQLNTWETGEGKFWKPAPILTKLVEENQSFGDLN